MADTQRIHGLDDLNRAIKELAADLRRKVVRAALRDAAKPIQRAAVANAPVLKKPHPYRLPGTLRKSIQIKSSKVFNGQNGEIGVFVSVSKRKGLGGKASARNPFDPFYWRFQEFGTARHGRQSFMEPAFKANTPKAIQIFQAKLKARIDKANKRK